MSYVLGPKSEIFALDVIRLYKCLCSERHEMVLSKQLLRSGTSIGANVAEAVYAQSKADFVSKYRIALKEASESAYWLKLLYKSDYITYDEYKSLKDECSELIRMLSAATKEKHT